MTYSTFTYATGLPLDAELTPERRDRILRNHGYASEQALRRAQDDYLVDCHLQRADARRVASLAAWLGY